MSRHRVVIIGSGFGGLFAAQALKRADVDVTLVARTTHHLFQPLLYQVATGILSMGEIAPSTREVLAGQPNARVVLGEVTAVDLDRRTITSTAFDTQTLTTYDSLIVAAGAGQSYFGNDAFAEFAPGLKSIDDALELRGRIFDAFEAAELATTQQEVDRALTFVVVGAGATGVEMAGQIAELSRRTLRRDFRRIDPTMARVVLLDALPVVLPAFGDKLGERARRRLEQIGVEVQLGAKVVAMDADGLEIEDAEASADRSADGAAAGRRRIEARTKVWAAGVQASPLARLLAEQSGAELDRSGRIAVQDDLTLPGHPEVFVVGDMITLKKYPGVAQLAIQGGRYAAREIVARLQPEQRRPAEPFAYKDKGSMATVSRFSAVASIGRLQLSGFIAWVAWLAVHLVYIIGFKQQVTTLLHWTVSFVGRGRAERTVTQQQVTARNALVRLRSGAQGDEAG